jgi:hypothetical protein
MTGWRDIYTEVVVVHLVLSCSDHSPVLVWLGQQTRQLGKKCLRYEIMWERDHALPEVIKMSGRVWEPSGTCEISMKRSLKYSPRFCHLSLAKAQAAWSSSNPISDAFKETIVSTVHCRKMLQLILLQLLLYKIYFHFISFKGWVLCV